MNVARFRYRVPAQLGGGEYDGRPDAGDIHRVLLDIPGVGTIPFEITALLDRARADGGNVIAIEAVELVLRPKHELEVRGNGDWYLRHPRCREPECAVGVAVRAAPLLSSPHAVGHTYEVWVEPGAIALSFLDVTGREGT